MCLFINKFKLMSNFDIEEKLNFMIDENEKLVEMLNEANLEIQS